jgi:phosphate transport system protein
MTTHFEQELAHLSNLIYKMADIVIEAISKGVTSLKNSDVNVAREVIDGDTELDALEIEIDNECIKLLVTRQPAAVHLRLVLSYLKINTDLERMGDLASNISKETVRLNGKPTLKPLVDIPRMAEIAINMIKKAFQAISDKDADLAKKVVQMDNDVDELNMQIYRELFSYMAENPATISQALGLIMVAKALERIADHATNIAEKAVYYVEGIDIRHEDQYLS